MLTYVTVFSIALGLLAGGAGHGKPAPVDEAGGRTVCPKIYAPVICDNGKTYPNQCEADKHHAQNCVPTGSI